MDLIIYALINDKVEPIAEFANKELFLNSFAKINSLRKSDGIDNDADKVVKAFADGAGVSAKQVKILKRALRAFDEVYLCNEIFDVLEELPDGTEYVGLSEAPSVDLVDLGIYDI